jgi:hypothetical protein
MAVTKFIMPLGVSIAFSVPVRYLQTAFTRSQYHGWLHA